MNLPNMKEAKIRTNKTTIIEATKEIKETKNTYKGDIRKLIKTLTEEMFDAAKRLQFERAAILRDKIQELEEEI